MKLFATHIVLHVQNDVFIYCFFFLHIHPCTCGIVIHLAALVIRELTTLKRSKNQSHNTSSTQILLLFFPLRSQDSAGGTVARLRHERSRRVGARDSLLPKVSD